MKTRLAVSAAAGLLLSVAASGYSGVSAAAEQCDVVAQTGCGPGEKCAVVLDDSGGQRIACAPDGSVALGGRCGSFAGVDDCVAGTACVGGLCRQACDPAQPGTCPTPQTCTAVGATGVGTCATLTSTAPAPDSAASTCDVVTQTGCGPGEKCAVVLDDSGAQRIACAPDGTVALAGRCGSFAGVDDCVGGMACVDGTCRQACDPAQPGACPTPQTCTAVGATGAGTCATLTSTAPAPDSAASTCDVVSQTGCRPGEKCAVLLDDSGGQRLACAPDGTVALGGRCGSFGGVDDCVGGTACVDGTCRQACDRAAPSSCPTPQTCTAAGEIGIGTCATLTSTASSPDLAASACDVVTQTGCRPGEKCALVSDGAGGERTACAPDGTVSLGGRCTSQGDLNDCVAGLSCVDGTCQRFCDPAQPFSCPTGQTCEALDSGGSVCRTSASTTTAPSPDLAVSTCDIVAQTGCRPGEKCALVSDGAGGEGTACAPDGTVSLGGRCTSQGDLDDCVAGLSCVDGTCQRFCDPAQPFSCPTGQTCEALDSGGSVCRTSTSTAATPTPAPVPAGACTAHHDCKPGTYCARDGTCHPETHTPRGITASPSLSNFRSGRVCFGPDGTKTVCEQGLDIKIDGRDTCRFNRKSVRCNWFGSEFDYEGFDPNIPIRCTWVRSKPANVGNWEGIRERQATRGTTELRLPGVCGHFVSAGFQNYATPPGGASAVVSVRFDCSYDGKPLFDVEYRFHFGP